MRQRIRNILLEATAFKDRSNINDAFWKWFGNSKVVDHNGDPLIVYRGSNNYHENTLTRSSVIYFASDPDIAEQYAYEDKPNIAPVYLRIENPVPIDVYYKEIGVIENSLSDNYSFEHYNNSVSNLFRSLGYDGAIASFDHWGAFQEGKEIFIVFDTIQIKSIFNKGTWNINEKNILK